MKFYNLETFFTSFYSDFFFSQRMIRKIQKGPDHINSAAERKFPVQQGRDYQIKLQLCIKATNTPYENQLWGN